MIRRIRDASRSASSLAPALKRLQALFSRAPGIVGARAVVWLSVAFGALSFPAHAQVASEGKGLLTLELGQGYAPVGGIASQVANPGTQASRDTLHATAFRFMAGYQFAEQLSAEVGVGHVGTMHSTAAYGAGDNLTAAASLVVVEADLVGHFPLTANTRLDLTLGITDTALQTTLSTQNGSALPIGQTNSDNVHRLGATAGVDLEWRLGDVSSVILGYHVYPRVGSTVIRDSAYGTAKAILAGLKFEF
jgi:outer membrane protein with beta-barrel domain